MIEVLGVITVVSGFGVAAFCVWALIDDFTSPRLFR